MLLVHHVGELGLKGVEMVCGSLDPCGCNLALERPDFH